jgi:WD40 repeat protein
MPASVICTCKNQVLPICDLHIISHIDEEGEHPLEVLTYSSHPKFNIELDEDDLEASNIQVRGHSRPITSIAVVEDFLFSGENDGLYKWSLEEASLISRHFTNCQVWSVSVSKSLQMVAGGLENHSIIIFDYFTDVKLANFQFSTAVLCLKFSFDGNFLVSGCEDGLLSCFNPHSDYFVFSRNDYNEAIVVLDITHDNNYIVTASDNKKVRLLDAMTGMLVKDIDSKFNVLDLKCTANNCVVYGGCQGILKVWDIKNEKMKSSDLNYQIYSILVTRDCKYIIVVNQKRQMNKYEFEYLTEYFAMDDESGYYLNGLAFDDEERNIYAIVGGWTVKVYQNDENYPFRLKSMIGHDKLVCVKPTRDGKSLVAAYLNGGVNIFETISGKMVQSFNSFEDASEVWDEYQEMGVFF